MEYILIYLFALLMGYFNRMNGECLQTPTGGSFTLRTIYILARLGDFSHVPGLLLGSYFVGLYYENFFSGAAFAVTAFFTSALTHNFEDDEITFLLSCLTVFINTGSVIAIYFITQT